MHAHMCVHVWVGRGWHRCAVKCQQMPSLSAICKLALLGMYVRCLYSFALLLVPSERIGFLLTGQPEINDTSSKYAASLQSRC